MATATQVAHMNVARLRHPPGDPRVAGFIDNTSKVNAIAEPAPAISVLFPRDIPKKLRVQRDDDGRTQSVKCSSPKDRNRCEPALEHLHRIDRDGSDAAPCGSSKLSLYLPWSSRSTMSSLAKLSRARFRACSSRPVGSCRSAVALNIDSPENEALDRSV